VFGVFRDVLKLQDLFDTKRVVFCFDKGPSKRVDDYPAYKANRSSRKEMTDEEEQTYSQFRQQMSRLRKDYLPDIGFQNVLWQQGFEADDILASVCKYSLMDKDEGIIVSSDNDMYQLLSLPNVKIWNPRISKIETAATFEQEWGIPPVRWVHCKAMAGCSGDNIKGVMGIGEKTAAKWQAGRLKSGSKAFERILAGHSIYARNLPLVRLPYPGVKMFDLVDDEVTDENWRAVTSKLGMKSLRELRV
jgi:DNA polymerase-1